VVPITDSEISAIKCLCLVDLLRQYSYTHASYVLQRMEQNGRQGRQYRIIKWQIKWLGLSTTPLGITRYIFYSNIKSWHQENYDIRHLWDHRVAWYRNSYCSVRLMEKGVEKFHTEKAKAWIRYNERFKSLTRLSPVRY